MVNLKSIVISIFFLYCTTIVCKIVLPHKLRYLENMLNSEVVAKAAKIRQRIEASPNTPDNDNGWPMMLANFQDDNKKSAHSFSYNAYNRRH